MAELFGKRAIPLNGLTNVFWNNLEYVHIYFLLYFIIYVFFPSLDIGT